MIRFYREEDGTEHLYATVTDEFDGRLIKDFLRGELSLSASIIKKAKYGGVLINGTAVTMRALLRTGDAVEVVLEGDPSEDIEPMALPFNIAYEDEHILIADKPINMPTHPSRANHLPTLANAVMAYMGKGFAFRAVNRLDRDTSGLVLIAKSRYSASVLSEQMKRGNFEKYYEAILANAPPQAEGTVDAPIERETEGSILRTVRADGKRAITEYKLTELLPDGRARVRIRLHTGRTHQIRVHMAYLGAPLYADFLYGERIEGQTYSLRCSRMVFTHPITKEKIDVNLK